MFGEIPAYGFFIRHVHGLEMSDVEVTYLKDDARSPFMVSDAKLVDLRHIKARHAPGVPSFILKDVEDFLIQQSRPLPDAKLAKVKQKQFWGSDAIRRASCIADLSGERRGSLDASDSRGRFR